MLDWLYQWFVSIVSWILSWVGISLQNRTVGGEVKEAHNVEVEVPSVYSMAATAEPQPMEA